MRRKLFEHVDIRSRKQKLLDLIDHKSTPDTIRQIAIDKLKQLIKDSPIDQLIKNDTDKLKLNEKPPIKTNITELSSNFCNGQTCGEIINYFSNSNVYPQGVYFFGSRKQILIVVGLPLDKPIHINDYYSDLGLNLKNIDKITKCHKVNCYEILVNFK